MTNIINSDINGVTIIYDDKLTVAVCNLVLFFVTFLALKKIILHMFKVTCHMSHFIGPMSHVTFHRSITPTATDLPLLTPPLSTVD